MRGIYIALIALLFWSCSNTTSDNQKYEGPLKDFFQYYNQLTTEKYKLSELESEYFSVLGKGDQQVIDGYIKDFDDMHKSIISAIQKKYPEKSLQLTFNQKNKTQVEVKNVYISTYQFPWNTATRLSYNVGFECNKLDDSPLSLVRFEFIDMDGDIIMSSNVAVTQNGSYQFEIRPEIEFFRFQKINVSTL